MSFTRPSHVSVPTVWHTFTSGRPLADGSIPKFRVQDVTGDLEEEVLELMKEHFLGDEPTCKSTNFKSCPRSVEKISQLWKDTFKARMALVCLLDEELEPGQKPTVVGANMTTIAYKFDEDDSPSGLEVTPYEKVLRSFHVVMDLVDVFEVYGVDKYMTAYGLVVKPEYRGQNIGAEILRARIPLCKAIGISVTATMFSAKSSQILAEKVGFETLAEITFEDIKLKYGIGFPNIDGKSAKAMALKIY